jgi:outer membrane protein TolC
MIDKRTMRSILKSMESVAMATLQQDSAFYEALHALKWEIDNDPDVRSAVQNLRAAGQSVFSSFVPQIKVRVRTEDGIFALTRQADPGSLAMEPVGVLTQQLKNAASAVIAKSHHCEELNHIVNEAVAANQSFEKMASEIENAGYEVLLSLDLSAYAQVRESSTPVSMLPPARRPNHSEAPPIMELSAHDHDFLKALKIKADENLPY